MAEDLTARHDDASVVRTTLLEHTVPGSVTISWLS